MLLRPQVKVLSFPKVLSWEAVSVFFNIFCGAAFLPWSAATERRRLLFFKISRFVVRWQNKKMQPVFTTWQNMIQKMHALENSAASLLYRKSRLIFALLCFGWILGFEGCAPVCIGGERGRWNLKQAAS